MIFLEFHGIPISQKMVLLFMVLTGIIILVNLAAMGA
jgi:hypothetical protein